MQFQRLWKRCNKILRADSKEMGQKVSKKVVIEDAEKIQIDSSPLHCPVCLQIFPSSPQILPCGHSFCKQCLRNCRARMSPNLSTAVVECALCRRVVPVQKVARNYVVDDILQSIDVYEPPEHVSESDVVSTQKITIQRLRAKNAEFTKKEMALEKKLKSMQTILCVIGVIHGILVSCGIGYLYLRLIA